MAREDPISRLPHRPPFLFVSRIDSVVAGVQGNGVWTVDGEEAFFEGHFPNDPVVPGVLLTEALAQLAGLVAAPDVRSEGRLAHVNVKFHTPVRPPADVSLEAVVERALGDLYLFNVRAHCAGVNAASGSLSLACSASDETPERC